MPPFKFISPTDSITTSGAWVTQSARPSIGIASGTGREPAFSLFLLFLQEIISE
jgi:hypothetical protein